MHTEPALLCSSKRTGETLPELKVAVDMDSGRWRTHNQTIALPCQKTKPSVGKTEVRLMSWAYQLPGSGQVCRCTLFQRWWCKGMLLSFERQLSVRKDQNRAYEGMATPDTHRAHLWGPTAAEAGFPHAMLGPIFRGQAASCGPSRPHSKESDAVCTCSWQQRPAHLLHVVQQRVSPAGASEYGIHTKGAQLRSTHQQVGKGQHGWSVASRGWSRDSKGQLRESADEIHAKRIQQRGALQRVGRVSMDGVLQGENKKE